MLRTIGWGILATVSAGRPYAVPVGYALGDDCVFVASGSGQKLMNLEANPVACLTVCDVDTYDSWRSVVIQGAATEVVGPMARTPAIAAFVMQRSPRGATGADMKRLLSARIFRIPLAGMSGKERGTRD
ncbi:MAG: pyridoxamine 5'-phosphate oxidase family protein [Gemmatimonadaceae bacterium]|nr:pyridoxamine 5'-phosphate oxidase family protein [Gemmatimonadaceae bacterium]